MRKPPGEGTYSKQVWDIADALGQEGRPPVRSDVITAAVKAGVHEKTASTQYGHWKRNKFPKGPCNLGARPLPLAASASRPALRRWDELLKYGFKYHADWLSRDASEIGLDHEMPKEAGVYVFVVDDTVMYIGVTQRTLHKRMADYRIGNSGQKTSSRVKMRLKDALESGATVKVLVVTSEPMEWNGWPVSTILGLEQGLIDVFSPPWNIQGKSQR